MKARRFFLAMAAGCTGIAGFTAAKAADLSPPPPPPPPQVVVVDEDPSCLYGRFDAGFYSHRRPTVTKNGGGAFGGGGGNSATGESMTKSGLIDVGAGCQATENFRIEATLGYRFKSSITDPFGSLDADLSTFTGFANAFWDIVTYNGFTPYLGAGVGFAAHRLSGINAPVGPNSGMNLTLAWNIQAGIAYDISESLKLDVAYRFVDLGTARSGGAPRLNVADLQAHEFKVGLRYKWGSW